MDLLSRDRILTTWLLSTFGTVASASLFYASSLKMDVDVFRYTSFIVAAILVYESCLGLAITSLVVIDGTSLKAITTIHDGVEELKIVLHKFDHEVGITSLERAGLLQTIDSILDGHRFVHTRINQRRTIWLSIFGAAGAAGALSIAFARQPRKTSMNKTRDEKRIVREQRFHKVSRNRFPLQSSARSPLQFSHHREGIEQIGGAEPNVGRSVVANAPSPKDATHVTQHNLDIKNNTNTNEGVKHDGTHVGASLPSTHVNNTGTTLKQTLGMIVMFLILKDALARMQSSVNNTSRNVNINFGSMVINQVENPDSDHTSGIPKESLKETTQSKEDPKTSPQSKPSSDHMFSTTHEISVDPSSEIESDDDDMNTINTIVSFFPKDAESDDNENENENIVENDESAASSENDDRPKSISHVREFGEDKDILAGKSDFDFDFDGEFENTQTIIMPILESSTNQTFSESSMSDSDTIITPLFDRHDIDDGDENTIITPLMVAKADEDECEGEDIVIPLLHPTSHKVQSRLISVHPHTLHKESKLIALHPNPDPLDSEKESRLVSIHPINQHVKGSKLISLFPVTSTIPRETSNVVVEDTRKNLDFTAPQGPRPRQRHAHASLATSTLLRKCSHFTWLILVLVVGFFAMIMISMSDTQKYEKQEQFMESMTETSNLPKDKTYLRLLATRRAIVDSSSYLLLCKDLKILVSDLKRTYCPVSAVLLGSCIMTGTAVYYTVS